MKQQRNMLQDKEQDKSLEMEIGELPDGTFKIVVIGWG